MREKYESLIYSKKNNKKFVHCSIDIDNICYRYMLFMATRSI